MRTALIVLVVAGCGRIALDPRAISVEVGKQYPVRGEQWMVATLPGSDADCPGERAFYDACVHAAERLAVHAPGIGLTCADLRFGDELGAFAWRCEMAGVDLVFTTDGLERDAGLATLVEADRWKPNRFTARRNGELIYASEPGAWWTNPVVPVTEGVPLVESGTIYTTSGRVVTAGITIDADRIALVGLGDATLVDGGGPLNCDESAQTAPTRCLVVSPLSRTGLWIENLELDGRGASTRSDFGLMLQLSLYTVVRNVRSHHHTLDGLVLRYVFGGLLRDVVATDNGRHGIHDFSSNYAGRHLVTAANAANGIQSRSAGIHALVDVTTFSNGGDGIRWDFDAAGYLVDVLAANNTGYGIRWTEAYLGGGLHSVTAINNVIAGIQVGDLDAGTLSHVVSVNNGGNGLMTDNWFDNEVANLVVANNAGIGLQHAIASNVRFSGRVLVGSNTLGNCSVTQGTNAGIDNACTSGAALTTAIDLRSSFAGPSPATTTRATITDWTALAARTQVWGTDGAALDASARGPCSANCRIWDYALATGDTVLRDAVGPAAVAGAACPDGATLSLTPPRSECINSFPASCPRVTLVNALELVDDHIGNEDGLCDSGEHCTYLPSFGVEQRARTRGEPCVFTDGTVTGVTLYATGT